MSDRSEHNLGFAEVTRKVMPNGEIRIRVRLPGDISTSITYMPVWQWQNGAPVQEGHYHRGLTEVCLVVTGWMLCVSDVIQDGYYFNIVEKGEVVTFTPFSHHLVLLGPETIIQTTMHGPAVGNPEVQDLDRWSTGEYYDKVKLTQELLTRGRKGNGNKEKHFVGFNST